MEPCYQRYKLVNSYLSDEPIFLLTVQYLVHKKTVPGCLLQGSLDIDHTGAIYGQADGNAISPSHLDLSLSIQCKNTGFVVDLHCLVQMNEVTTFNAHTHNQTRGNRS